MGSGFHCLHSFPFPFPAHAGAHTSQRPTDSNNVSFAGTWKGPKQASHSTQTTTALSAAVSTPPITMAGVTRMRHSKGSVLLSTQVVCCWVHRQWAHLQSLWQELLVCATVTAVCCWVHRHCSYRQKACKQGQLLSHHSARQFNFTVALLLMYICTISFPAQALWLGPGFLPAHAQHHEHFRIVSGVVRQHLARKETHSENHSPHWLRKRKPQHLAIALLLLPVCLCVCVCVCVVCVWISPATDIRKSAQPTSTSYPASTNKEPPRHLSKQPSHTSCYTSWSRGHNLQSIHHNSFT